MNNISEIDNILLNMSAGLLPEHLTKSEIELLETKYGQNWFTELGYIEEQYNRNILDNFNN